MKRVIYIISALIWALLSFVACSGETPEYATRTDAVVAQLRDPSSKYVIVVCHRGDWRNWPENSIPAIQSVIDMGADMVEIDLKMTADSVLVLCHDEDVKRTTNFSKVFTDGRSADVSKLTLAQIKSLSLKRGHGEVIDTLRMPTLREALLVTKDKICVNVDQGWDYYDEVLKVSEELGVTDQLLIKGKMSIQKVDSLQSSHASNMMYMPIVDIQKPKGAALFDSYLEEAVVPIAYEVCWKNNADGAFDEAASKIIAQGSKLWVNTLWPSLCGGHGNDDDAAYQAEDPGAVYGQYLDKGVSIIQTDRPELLIDWLSKRGRHNL